MENENKNLDYIDESRIKKLSTKIKNRMITGYVIIGLSYLFMFYIGYASKVLIWQFLLLFLFVFIADLAIHTHNKIRQCFVDGEYREVYLTIGFNNPLLVFIVLPLFLFVAWLTKEQFTDAFIMLSLMIIPLLFIYIDRRFLKKEIDYGTVNVRVKIELEERPDYEFVHELKTIPFLVMKGCNQELVLNRNFKILLDKNSNIANSNKYIDAARLLKN